jgi:hypothetical protein
MCCNSTQVKIKLHNHFLNLIYSPHEINKRDNMFCRICGDKVNTEYAAYCCQQCSYVLHTECLRSFRDEYGESSATSESVPNYSVGRATHLIKALNQAEDEGPHPGEIQHFSHQEHKLILCNDEIKDDKLCGGCMEFITSIPFYSCAQCIFFFHARCVELPKTIEQYPLHDFHSLTLLPRASNKSGVFFCDLCSRHHRGFTYKCDTVGGRLLMFNAPHFRKPLNTKVISISSTLLKILRIENAKLVLRTTRGMSSYAPVAISSWELDVQIFHW